jgi:two-component system invasion response regulator UvrY
VGGEAPPPIRRPALLRPCRKPGSLNVMSAMDEGIRDTAVGAVRVLVVDDQTTFREVARTVVDMTPGFAVVAEALSGEGAILAAAEHLVELVLMDIHLLGLDGIEATRLITQAAPGTVVLLMSTYDALDLPGEARTCGAADYVSKENLSPAVISDTWAAVH